MPYQSKYIDGLRVKHSSVPGEVMPPDGLSTGEVAWNSADGKIYFRGPGGTLATVDATLGPDWRSANAVSWPVFQASMLSTIAASPAIDDINTPTGGSLGGGNGAAVHPDGKVYWAQNSTIGSPTAVVYSYDCETNIVAVEVENSDVGSSPTTDSWSGAYLLPDGGILFVPYAIGTRFILFYPDSGSATLIGPAAPGNSYWYEGARTATGDVIICARNSKHFMLFEHYGKKFVDLPWDGAWGTGNAGCRSGVLLPDGRTYLYPYSAAYGFVWDGTSLERVDGSVQGSAAHYCTGALLPNGTVYLNPFSSSLGGRLLPDIDDSGTWGYTSAQTAPRANITASAMLPNGRLVGVPYTVATDYAELYDYAGDSYTRSTAPLPVVTSSTRNTSATALPNGRVLFLPQQSDQRAWTYGQAGDHGFSMDLLMSPYFSTN